MSRQHRRSSAPPKQGIGLTLATVFVMIALLVGILKTQRSIANRLSEAFEALAVDEGSGESADAPMLVGFNALPLVHEQARIRVHLALSVSLNPDSP